MVDLSTFYPKRDPGALPKSVTSGIKSLYSTQEPAVEILLDQNAKKLNELADVMEKALNEYESRPSDDPYGDPAFVKKNLKSSKNLSTDDQGFLLSPMEILRDKARARKLGFKGMNKADLGTLNKQFEKAIHPSDKFGDGDSEDVDSGLTKEQEAAFLKLRQQEAIEKLKGE